MMFIFGMGIGLLLVVFFITLIESGVVSFLWGNLQRCNPFYWRSQARQCARELQLSIANEDWLREQFYASQGHADGLSNRIKLLTNSGAEMLVKLADKDESIRMLGVFLESREHVIDSLWRHINSSVVEPKLVVPKKTKKKKS